MTQAPRAATYAIPPTFLGVGRSDRDGADLRRRHSARPRHHQPQRRPLRPGGHPPRQPDAGGRRASRRTGSIRRRCRVADIGDFALALGDIPASLQLIEDAARGHRASDRAGRRSQHHAAAVARAEQAARPARAHSLRCPCRHLARQFRPGLRPRLGVLPRHRGRPGRAAPDDPDRHPLAGAARGSRLDRRRVASPCCRRRGP